MEAGVVEIYQDANLEWRFRRKAGNGEIVASSEGYVHRRDAVAEAAELFPGINVVGAVPPDEPNPEASNP